MSGVPFLITAVLCTAIALSILWVNPRRLINQVIGLTSLFVSSSFICTYAAISVHEKAGATGYTSGFLFWLRANGATYAFVPWTLWLMKEGILSERGSLLGLMRRSWPVFSASVALAIICCTEAYIPTDSDPAQRRGMGYVFFTCSMYVLIGLIMLSAYRAARQISGVRRIEMQFFLLNACVAGLLVVVINMIRRIHDIPGLTYAPSMMVICCLCIIVWAVSYHRVFDARQIMVSIGHRVIMLATLAVGTLGLFDLFSFLFESRLALVLGAIIAGIVVFYCNRITRKWLRLDLEQQLTVPRAEIIACTQRESDPDVLRACFEELLKQWCQTDLAEVVYAREAGFVRKQQPMDGLDFPRLYHQGWITPEYLQRLRQGANGEKILTEMSRRGFSAVVVAPRGSDVPSLVVGLGAKYSARPYTYPDITVLLNVAELMDNILTHASLSQHAAKIAQMEAAALMSRSLAHDLNNLTTPVATYLLYSQGRATPGTAEGEVYDAALHSVKVMNDYIRESLFFSRHLTPDFKMLNPHEGLLSVTRLTRERAAKRNVNVTSHCEEGICFLADSALFQRLTLNLVNNAIDASPTNSSIVVSVGSKNLEQVYLCVEDQGAGIPVENLKRIFEPYFTTKNTGDTGRGLGLGLAICRKIVDLHGGEIEIDSVPGKGAAFRVVFPVRRSVGNHLREPIDIGSNSLSMLRPGTAVGLA